ncbi:MAG: formylglycine-generating enzyme family protein [Saprospiraceae bacterium]|nr:formylglycine-generating enzyme family protein [Saprospiraceae bacterium]
MPVLEKAYLQSIREQPTEQKVRAYLRDFPESERLPEVTEAAKSRPEVLEKVQPELEDAYLKRLEVTPTEREAEKFLESFPAPQKREKFEQILEQKPQIRRRVIDKMERSRDVGLLDRPGFQGSEGVTQSHPLTSSAEPARFDYEMVSVQGGSFTMGCLEDRDGDCGELEKPPHTVTISSFQIGKYEVTQVQWRVVMGSDPPKLYNKGCDQCPVEGVSWYEVQDFLKKLNIQTGKHYRLPTEAEWEYAARGGTKSKGYRYAGSNNIEEVAWHDGNSQTVNTYGLKKTTHPVGQKKPNEVGMFDMSGNVLEWCSDGYERYSSDKQHDPMGPASDFYRIVRGGSWGTVPKVCRVAYRNYYQPADRMTTFGLRLARSQ